MISENLKKILEEKKITQAELAKNVGITQAYASYLLNGFKQPSVELLKRIADFLDVSLDELVRRGYTKNNN